MSRTYLRVEPSEDRPIHEDVVNLYSGFRKIKDDWTRRFHPLKDPPKFENLIVCAGYQNPIKFYWGVCEEGDLETFRSTLVAAYPGSYDIHREKVDLVKEIIPENVDYQNTHETLSNPGGGRALDEATSNSHSLSDGGTVTEPAQGESDTAHISRFPDTNSEEERILNGLSHLDPVGVHWYARGERRADWQTLIKRFTQQTKRHQRQKDGRKSRARTSPLGVILDEMAEMDHPVMLQTVFHRRRFWGWKASRRKARIQSGTDGVIDTVGTAITSIAGAMLDDPGQDQPPNKELEGDNAREQTDDTGADIGSRSEHIDKKGTSETYKANIRAIGFAPPGKEDEKAKLEKEMEAIANGFNNLSGPYYNITGKIVKHGFRERIGKRPTPTQLVEDMVRRRVLVSLFTRTRLQFILNADELSNFTHIPSRKELTTESQRATRSTDRERSPLPLPEPEQLDAYQEEGVKIGKPIDEHGEELTDPIKLPPAVLNHNYFRSGAIGTGKSISIVHELKSFRESTSGANILIEPKGGGLARDYLRSHYAKYGNLDDVIYLDMPEIVPAIPFFDIRPKLQQGFDRADAVQDKVVQFDEIMRIAMGDDQYESAQISIDLLKNLIKAKFDTEYGTDAFTVSELRQELIQLYTEQKVPQLSPGNSNIQDRLQFLIESDDHHFSTVATGAMNRLSIITEDDRMRQMLNYIPEWGPLTDDDGTEITDGDGTTVYGYQQGLNMHRLVNKDKTIIFDVGALREDSAKLLSLIFIGQLWDVARARLLSDDVFRDPHGSTETPDDFVIGTIIDEAKLVAGSSLVSDLLSQGREFNLSLGLVMQFPEQMENADHELSVYKELIRNTGVKILGKTDLSTDISEVLASEDIDAEEYKHRLSSLPDGEWIVDAKGVNYFDEQPRPFSIRSLPMPEGHPEGDNPVTPDETAFDTGKLASETSGGRGLGTTGSGDSDTLGAENRHSPSTNDGDSSEDSDSLADLISGPPSERVSERSTEQTNKARGDGGDTGTGLSTDTTDTYESFEDAIHDLEVKVTKEYAIPDDLEPAESEDEISLTIEGDSGKKRSSGFNPGGGDTDDDPPPASMEMGGSQEPQNTPEAESEQQGVSPRNEPYSPLNKGLGTTNGDTDVASQPSDGEASTPTREIDITNDEQQMPDSAGGGDASANTSATSEGGQTTEETGGRSDAATSESERAPGGDDATAGAESVSESAQTPPEIITHSESDIENSAAGARIAEMHDELADEYGLEWTDKLYLDSIAQAINEQVDGYDLTQSMSRLPGYDGANIDRLTDAGLIERHLYPRVYHDLTTSGWELVANSQPTQPGRGDLGEKLTHRIGCYVTKQWLESAEQITQATRYYPADQSELSMDVGGPVVYDVVGFGPNNNIVAVAEIETESNDWDGIRSDYEKLAAMSGESIWVVDKQSTLKDVLKAIQQEVDDQIPVDRLGNISYKDMTDELEYPGITRTQGIENVLKGVE